jgi:hypothetical protein
LHTVNTYEEFKAGALAASVNWGVNPAILTVTVWSNQSSMVESESAHCTKESLAYLLEEEEYTDYDDCWSDGDRSDTNTVIADAFKGGVNSLLFTYSFMKRAQVWYNRIP